MIKKKGVLFIAVFYVLTFHAIAKLHAGNSYHMLRQYSCANPIDSPLYNTADRFATLETRRLYASLQRLIWAGVIVGHHDDLAYGVGWRGEEGRSDIKSITGSYPALYGWDLSGIELGNKKDINSIPFNQQKKYVQQVYNRGGINTFCWHLNNPVNGKTAWDTSLNVVKAIIPGGNFNREYVKRLDKLAKYLSRLKGRDGEYIPILFRPYHELTGSWFWWGKKWCTPDEFKSLWKFTITYLRDVKHLHNLLVVYSVGDNFTSAEDFLERYPGDNYVDVVGFDTYCYQNVPKFKDQLNHQLTITQTIAAKHHKLFAIAETGYEGIPQDDWWTKCLLDVVKKYPLSYMMLWRNESTGHFYVPYAGQRSAEDFRHMFDNPETMFQNRITLLNVYGNK